MNKCEKKGKTSHVTRSKLNEKFKTFPLIVFTGLQKAKKHEKPHNKQKAITKANITASFLN